MNVVFDDSVGFYQTRVTQTVDSVTPTISVPIEAKVKDETEKESDQEGEHINLDQGRVHKNHSSTYVIGGVFDEIFTRKKQIDFKEMVKLTCFISKMGKLECFISLIEPKT